MKLAIFGATGPSGKLLVHKALSAGHAVTVYARNPSKLSGLAGVTVVQGELTESDAIARAVGGQDAVLSLLGPTRRSTGTPVADGTRLIVKAMQAAGVKRLIATATPSAADPLDGSALSFRLVVAGIKAFAGSAYTEIVTTAQVVRDSGLDWTLVRLPMLSNAPASKPAAAGYLGDPRIKLFSLSSLSRETLTDFMLAQLTDRTWLHKAPVLSNG
jgi:uncharacterized protein YbjT (DUF2867 family)